jgi:hypothetical protein
MFDPLPNPLSPQKSFSGITQARIVIDRGEPSYEDKDYFKRKHNPMMPRINPIKKLYHEYKGRPSLIGDASRSPTSGQVVPISNSGGVPFNIGGNRLLGGGDGGAPEGGNDNLLRNNSNNPLGNNNNGLLKGCSSGPSRD